MQFFIDNLNLKFKSYLLSVVIKLSEPDVDSLVLDVKRPSVLLEEINCYRNAVKGYEGLVGMGVGMLFENVYIELINPE